MRWLLVAICLTLCLSANPARGAEPPIEIGDRLELFLDGQLIGKLSGGAAQRLHHPTPQEVAIVFDAPWEGSGCGYHSVFQDGDLYRMYYRGWQLTVEGKKLTQPHPPVTCYAESRDGIHWTKPRLKRQPFEGSKDNNIILTLDSMGGAPATRRTSPCSRTATPTPRPTQGTRPSFVRGPKGLLPYKSADGLAWSPMATQPVITRGAFDSQNLAFWDPLRREYRCYFRDFRNGLRDIKTATSQDFLTWTEPQWLTYPQAPKEQLYTNQILPYYRAPHIFIGLPTRYVDRGWNASIKAAPELTEREQRAEASRRYGTAVTEGLLMSSRDGQTFHRWGEAFLRPGPARPGSWAYGDQYIAWQMVETASKLPGAARAFALRLGRLLDRPEQPTAPLYLAHRRIRFHQRAPLRRRTGYQTLDVRRRPARIKLCDFGRRLGARRDSGRRGTTAGRFRAYRQRSHVWRHPPARRRLEGESESRQARRAAGTLAVRAV